MTEQQYGAYEDLQPSIGDRLRVARERRTGMDQATFADHIGVSRGTVSNYERDKLPGGPRQRLVLNAWASACNVTREWLETGRGGDAGGPPPTGPRVDPGPSPHTPDVVDALSRLTAAKLSRSRTGGSTQRYPQAA